jgi:glucosamine-6-phosphate deaminase
MEIIIRRDADAVAQAAFEVVAESLRARPALVVGLATGRTPLALYARLRAARLDWSRARFFNLDEFVGLGPDDPKSFARALREALLDGLGVPRSRARLVRGDAPDPARECAAVEAAVRRAGGLDLQILGVGRDGHIGFNEPSSSFGSRTRVKTLAAETIHDAGGGVPFHAITMGIGTILEARRLLLLATGPEKAGAVARAVEGPMTAEVPASALQLHPRATVVLDDAAASKLARRDYYRFVEANKWRVAPASRARRP